MVAHNGYMIVAGGHSLYMIKHDGKGSVPAELKGLYTHKDLAQRAIDQYVAKRAAKGGKTE